MKTFTIIIVILVLVLAVYHTAHKPQTPLLAPIAASLPEFDKRAYMEWIDREVGRPAYNKWKLAQALNEYEQDRIRRGE